MPARKAASVLPEPVGAQTSVSRPRGMRGQPAACASVGAPKRRSNQAWTAGWNEASTSEVPVVATIVTSARCERMYVWPSIAATAASMPS